MSDLFLAGASLDSIRLRLSAVCELGASLGEIDNVEFPPPRSSWIISTGRSRARGAPGTAASCSGPI